MTTKLAPSSAAYAIASFLFVHGAGASNPSPVSPPPAAASTESTRFSINDASKRHSFEIEMTGGCAAQFRESDYCEGPAVVRVVSRATQKETQTLELSNLVAVRGVGDALIARSSEVADDASSLVFDDFNFDGLEDFAVQTGTNGAYGGPTYQVFLFQKRTGKFILATELSDLTEGYLGLFDVDHPRKRITTYSKGGCCYHESREYEFVGIRPVLVARFTEDATANDGYVLETSEQLMRGRWVKRVTRTKASDAGEDW